MWCCTVPCLDDPLTGKSHIECSSSSFLGQNMLLSEEPLEYICLRQSLNGLLTTSSNTCSSEVIIQVWLQGAPLIKTKKKNLYVVFDLPNQNGGKCSIMKHTFKQRDKFCIWNMNTSVSKYNYLLLHRTEYTSHTCEYVIKDYKYSVQ